MSSGDRMIVCRQCKETVSRDVDNCPHCGTPIRGRTIPIASLVIGVLLAASTAFDIGALWPFTVVGLLLAVGGGYLLYEQRQRIDRAERPASSRPYQEIT